MTNRTNNRNALAKIVLSALMAAGLLGSTYLSAESQQATQRKTDDYYHHVIKPQQDKAAADTAEILARPSNWGPGEIRDAVNHGALAWYEKSPGRYGYIFMNGYIRQSTADAMVELECSSRKLACVNSMQVVNAWLVIGSYKDRHYFVTASADTRAEAEALVQNKCRADGTTCTIKDAFDVTPHRRGVSFQRLKKVVR